MKPARDLSLDCDLVGVEDYPDLQSDWTLLEDRADCSPFISWPWVSTWLRHLPDTYRPLVFRVRDADGLIALGLLIEVPERGLRRIFGDRSIYLQETGNKDIDEITIEYAGLLVRPGFETASYSALFKHLGARGGNWRRLRISGSSHVETLVDALPGNLQAFSVDARVSYTVDLAALRSHGHDYIATLGTRTRRGLRRTRRAYERLGELRAEVVGSAPEALAWLDELRVLHERRWRSKGQPGSFASRFFSGFHRDLVAAGTATGFTQLMRISAGSLVVGYLYNIVWRKRVYFYNVGLNYGALGADDRPGYVAQLVAIEKYLADGMEVYDFMAGDQEYKRNLGATPDMLHWVDVRPRGIRLGTECALSKWLHRRTIGTPLATATDTSLSPNRD